ncbi:MAG: sugar phosphate isomerase/epimerase, partial [Candidatus Hinthialibacter sp.]
MKKNATRVLWMLTAIVGIMAAGSILTQAEGYPNELYVGGFLVGPQAYTFNRFSFFEAVDKAKEAGASVIEAYPGQRLAPDDERPFNHDAPPAVWAKAKMKLEKTGVRLVNYGVVGLGSTEESM